MLESERQAVCIERKKTALLTFHVTTETHFHWKQPKCMVLSKSKLYRQVVEILMGTNRAPLVENLFVFCYEKDFMVSLSDVKQANIIDTFNSAGSKHAKIRFRSTQRITADVW